MNSYAVFYCKNPTFTVPFLTRADIHDGSKYVQVKGVIEAEDKEDVFFKMQGEQWSPNGEARPLIEQLGLHHTSMSVGDAIIDLTNNEYWVCAAFGWVGLDK